MRPLTMRARMKKISRKRMRGKTEAVFINPRWVAVKNDLSSVEWPAVQACSAEMVPEGKDYRHSNQLTLSFSTYSRIPPPILSFSVSGSWRKIIKIPLDIQPGERDMLIYGNGFLQINPRNRSLGCSMAGLFFIWQR